MYVWPVYEKEISDTVDQIVPSFKMSSNPGFDLNHS